MLKIFLVLKQDARDDVGGAMKAGMKGILVKTGIFIIYVIYFIYSLGLIYYTIIKHDVHLADKLATVSAVL